MAALLEWVEWTIKMEPGLRRYYPAIHLESGVFLRPKFFIHRMWIVLNNP